MTDALTPMMRQYRRIKGDLPSGVILFFRLGDFYEMFFEDAKEAAPILGITLTKRHDMPMCGIPFHALDSYLSKLIRAGRRVAICEQTEDPATTKGIVRREVSRIVTPGTVTEDNILDADRHNFLAGVCHTDGVFGVAFLDLSTGLFWGETADTIEKLGDILKRFSPNECVVPERLLTIPPAHATLERVLGTPPTLAEDWTFDYEAARDYLIRHFSVHSLAGFGCEGNTAVAGAAGGVLYYVKEDLRRQVAHVRSFSVRSAEDYLLLDDATCANLDLVASRSGGRAATLLGVLDATRTAMGGRTLRRWLLQPLADLEAVTRRHDAVEALTRRRDVLSDLREALGSIRDIERLISRINTGSGNARDLRAVGQSLTALPDVKQHLEQVPLPLFNDLADAIRLEPELSDLIDRAISDEPPPTVKDGGIIKDGHNAELDELRRAASSGRKWLAEYQALEQQRTGIKTLKIRHNRVFGYYIEVSKAQAANVPEDYARKQTLVNAERFFTPQLKDYEHRILGAQDRAMALEYEIFLDVRQAVIDKTVELQTSAEALAQLDVLGSLADRALALGYAKPTMHAGGALHIKAGRHPVIEQMPNAERFVPNDALLDGDENQIIIITGPNMAGKSTYIRQVALIVIMAHMGSFVPADEADIGVTDRVFTRVGASDDLARGRSTFMVEMQETANILNNATPRSLVVLDEIGRGTSTFDGISIAWAVAEHLHNRTELKPKTLFATHYHELTDLARTMGGVKNYNVLVRERDDQVVFLRRIVPGSADKSYGIQVARLAGLPDDVIERAKEILANLEEGELGESGQPTIARRRGKKGKDDPLQMALF